MAGSSVESNRNWQVWLAFCFVSILIWTASLAGQEQAPPESITAAPQLVEVARSAKSLYITGREGWVGIPSEPLEKKLFEYPEFKKGELILLRKPAGADIVVELDRKSGTWDFTYQMIHRESGIILGTGKVIAWDGVRAGSGLAKQIIKRLRELRGGPQAGSSGKPKK